MTAIKRIFRTLFFLIAIILLALLAFVATFDANNYKPQIIEQAEKATGRDFRIDGDISLSIFPFIGIKIEQVALGNAQGFKADAFASIEQLDVSVNVLPLLKKQLEINTIRLHGLRASLEVAKNKTNNWSDIGARPESDGSGSDAPDSEAAEAPAQTEQKVADQDKVDQVADTEAAGAAAFDLQSLHVEGFEFVDAEIRYHDRSTGMLAQVTELNLETGEISFDEFVDVSFETRVQNNQPELDSRIELTTQLRFDKAFSSIQLADFVLSILADTEFLPQQETITLKSQIDVSMPSQTVKLSDTALSALGTVTETDISVKQFQSTPLIEASLAVQPFDARDIAARAGVVLPEMARADALDKVALSTRILMQGDRLEANDFSVKLDDSSLTGWVQLASIAAQSVRFDLTLDRIDVNDYMPPAEAEPATAAGKEVASEQSGTAPAGGRDASKSGSDTGGSDTGGSDAASDNASELAATDIAKTTGDEKIELPLAMMRQLDIKGDFRITALKALDYDISNFHLGALAKDGVIKLEPVTLDVLEGKVAAVVDMDVREDIPDYGIKLDVDQVQAGPVVNPFLVGLQGENDISLSGAIDLAMGMKTRGESVNQLKKASKGRITLDMKETRVDNFDPEYYMRKSVAEYVDSKGFGLSKTIMGSFSPREVTVFDSIYSNIDVADGKARTDDFLMDSKRVDVGAKGYVDIIENSVDMVTSVSLPRGKTAVEKVLDEPLFVHVYGPFTALQYEIDTDKLKESTVGVLEAEARAKLEAEKARLKAKADAEKAKLKARAEAEKAKLKAKADAEKARLKALEEEEKRKAEEKAKQELKETTDKYEDKLKDKLKGLF